MNSKQLHEVCVNQLINYSKAPAEIRHLHLSCALETASEAVQCREEEALEMNQAIFETLVITTDVHTMIRDAHADIDPHSALTVEEQMLSTLAGFIQGWLNHRVGHRVVSLLTYDPEVVAKKAWYWANE